MNSRFLVFSSMFFTGLFIQCNSISKGEFLDGEFGTASSFTAQTGTPIDGAKLFGVIGTDVTLEWNAVPLATKYKIEIANDKDFNEPVDESPVTFERTGNTSLATSITIVPTDAVSYFWRVTTEVGSKVNSSDIAVFHVFDNNVYVYCASDADCLDNETTQVGNKSFPFRGINTALVAAATFGANVNVAGRGDYTSYEETLDLVNGVSVYGGFVAPDYSEENKVTDPLNEDATILAAYTEKTVIGIGIDEDLTLSGLHVDNYGGSRFSYGIYIAGSSATVTITNSYLTSGESLERTSAGIGTNNANVVIENTDIVGPTKSNTLFARAVHLVGGQVQIIDSRIFGADNDDTAIFNGIRAEDGAIVYVQNSTVAIPSYLTVNDNARAIECVESVVFLTNSLIIGTQGSAASGIYSTDCSIVVVGNRIYAPRGNDGDSVGIYLKSAQAFISGNTIVAGESVVVGSVSTDSSIGIYADGAEAMIRQNSIVSRAAESVAAPLMFSENVDGVDVLANTLVLKGSAATQFGIDEGSGANHDPNSVIGNFFLDFINYYHDNNVNVLDEFCTGSFGTGGCTTNLDVNTTASGNSSSTAAASFNQLILQAEVLQDGPDNNTTYDGDADTLEVGQCDDGRFVVGEYIEIDGDTVAREITAVDCSSSTSFVSFSPGLDENQTFGYLTLYASVTTNYDQSNSLLAGAGSLNTQACSASAASFRFVIGESDNDCDALFEDTSLSGDECSNSSYTNQTDCETNGFLWDTFCTGTYIPELTEIVGDDIGNENGLCEANEDCLFNPNSAGYAGHGTLQAAGCDVSGTLSGVNVYEHADNGR